jgi:hypothetical protein
MPADLRTEREHVVLNAWVEDTGNVAAGHQSG